MVDDFAVERPDAWASLGLPLLREMSRAARARGAVQVVVVAGRHDEPKRLALEAAGLVVASEWWAGPIVSPDGRARGERRPTPHTWGARPPKRAALMSTRRIQQWHWGGHTGVGTRGGCPREFGQP